MGSHPATAGAESRRQKELYNKEFNFLDYGFLNLNHPCAARAVDVRVEWLTLKKLLGSTSAAGDRY